MTNPDLARDYFTRARKRLKAVALLLDEEAFADVVRESQEVVELLLKVPSPGWERVRVRGR
jgi:HEPN domain-containing protein